MKPYFFIRTSGKYIKIRFNDILYIEGCRNYLKIVTDSASYLALITFKKMEALLDETAFLRIHKSYIISVDRVDEFGHDYVSINNKILPIGHNFRGRLERSVTIVAENNLLELLESPVENHQKQVMSVV